MQVVRGSSPADRSASTAAVVVVFTIFMLCSARTCANRLVRLLGSARCTRTSALDDAAQRVSRYLLMQALINGVPVAWSASASTCSRVPNALLWGALTIVLRFVPYLGPDARPRRADLLASGRLPG